MSETLKPSVPPSQVGGAARVALARLALDLVSTMPGVAGTDAGPGGLCVTADPPFGVLRGVSVIAQPDGRYEVALCLVARMVPLLSLGEDIRRQLRARAAREGLADQLGTVNVEFSRAVGPGETMVEILSPEVSVGAETPQVVAGSPSPTTGSTGSQIPLPPIPPAPPSGLPEEPRPGQAGTSPPPSPPSPLPTPPAPPPSTAPTAPPAPRAVPEEPEGSVGSQPPIPDPPGPPIPSPGSAGPAPSSGGESRS